MSTPIRVSNNSRAIVPGQYLNTQNTRTNNTLNNSRAIAPGQYSPATLRELEISAQRGNSISAERLAAHHDLQIISTTNLEEKDTHRQMSKYYRDLARQNSQTAVQAQRNTIMARPVSLDANKYNELKREALNGNSASAEELAAHHQRLASITSNKSQQVAHELMANDYRDLSRKISQNAIAAQRNVAIARPQNGITPNEYNALKSSALSGNANHAQILESYHNHQASITSNADQKAVHKLMANDFNELKLKNTKKTIEMAQNFVSLMDQRNIPMAIPVPAAPVLRQTPTQRTNPIAAHAHDIQAQRNARALRRNRVGVDRVLSGKTPEQQLKTIANHAGQDITTATSVKGRLGRFFTRMVHAR